MCDATDKGFRFEKYMLLKMIVSPQNSLLNRNKSFVVRIKTSLIEGRIFSGINRRLKSVIVAMGKSALRRPWIKRSVLAVLNLSPELKNRLYRLIWKDIALAPRAMRIYTALSNAIPTHNKGND